MLLSRWGIFLFIFKEITREISKEITRDPINNQAFSSTCILPLQVSPSEIKININDVTK